MKTIRFAAGMMCAALALSAAPLASQASPTSHANARQTYHRTTYRHTGYRYSRSSDCWSAHHRAGRNGTIIGALTGGFLGSQLAGSGSRTGGMLIGAGVGAVAGHQIGAHSHRCR